MEHCDFLVLGLDGFEHLLLALAAVELLASARPTQSVQHCFLFVCVKEEVLLMV